MARLTDEELINELKARFDENKDSLDRLNEMNDRLKELNQKLELSESVKSHFLSNIKNEINNPLASILGLSRNLIILKELDLNKVTSTADLIHSEAFSLDFQLRNIFSAAEIEAGEAYPQPANVEVHSVVKSVIKSFEHRLNKKKIVISYETELSATTDDEFFFVTDSNSLRLIISNLISNAIEFSDLEKEVHVKSWITEDQLFISISDFGIGIEEEKQKIIFDRFEQLDKGTTKSHLGHGLGLSVVRGLLDILAGDVNVKSDLSKGSTFTINIPSSPSEGLDDTASSGNEFFFNADESF